MINGQIDEFKRCSPQVQEYMGYLLFRPFTLLFSTSVLAQLVKVSKRSDIWDKCAAHYGIILSSSPERSTLVSNKKLI